MNKMSYEERRNLSFAFISGFKYGQHHKEHDISDTEFTILRDQFLDGLPLLIKSDESGDEKDISDKTN